MVHSFTQRGSDTVSYRLSMSTVLCGPILKDDGICEVLPSKFCHDFQQVVREQLSHAALETHIMSTLSGLHNQSKKLDYNDPKTWRVVVQLQPHVLAWTNNLKPTTRDKLSVDSRRLSVLSSLALALSKLLDFSYSYLIISGLFKWRPSYQS